MGYVNRNNPVTYGSSIVLPKASGNGIKVDVTTPTFTYRDIIGLVLPDPAGTNSPALNAFYGNVRGYQYAAGDKLDCVYHIPHDYVPGSNVFVHLHWGHNAATISGNFVTDIAATYAKRTLAAPFATYATPIALQIAVNGLTIGNYPQHCHVVTELQLSAAAGAGGLLNTDNIEPDGLINITFTYNGTMATDPYIFTGDVHYLSTNIGTKSKDPDFYV